MKRSSLPCFRWCGTGGFIDCPKLLYILLYLLLFLPFSSFYIYRFVLWDWGLGLIGCISLSPSLALPTSFNNNNIKTADLPMSSGYVEGGRTSPNTNWNVRDACLTNNYEGTPSYSEAWNDRDWKKYEFRFISRFLSIHIKFYTKKQVYISLKFCISRRQRSEAH